jgi:hypothetical protein
MAQIVSIAGAGSGVFIQHTQGGPIPVLAWALLDDGNVRPMFEGWRGESRLALWEQDATFVCYQVNPG